MKFDNIDETTTDELEVTKKRKLKKYNTIEVDENPNSNDIIYNKNESVYLEVKDKKFKSPCEIEEKVLYDGNLFYKDKHPTKSYPNIINYRCINYRKMKGLEKLNFVMQY